MAMVHVLFVAPAARIAAQIHITDGRSNTNLEQNKTKSKDLK